ncbi:MobF family relaxase [Nocardia asteroides]|uniref:MobF family relaxase n=1 Tax=Nocardia asteroides TaxID=1824 RepID=UPI0037C4F97C
MITHHVVHAGDGFRYLTRTVASGDMTWLDETDLAALQQISGTPPGQWIGRGAAAMGVSGQVSPEQMLALYGEGLHPNAAQILADALEEGIEPEKALRSARLAAPFAGTTGVPAAVARGEARLLREFHAQHRRTPSRRESLQLHRQATADHLEAALGQPPTDEQLDQALTAEKERKAKAVAAIELAASGPKSVSLLFALGSDEVRQIVRECDRQALEETLAYAEERYSLARRGHGGARQIDTDGWTAATFTHWDNRVGDPHLHTHVAISSIVRGVDGRWSRLDPRALRQATVSLSCRYNAVLVGKLQRRLGVVFEERHRGRGKAATREIVGIPDELLALFSRRDAIDTRTEELILDYRRTTGRSPTKAIQYQLAQKATLETRGNKKVPRSLGQMFSEWNERATEWLAAAGDARTASEFLTDTLAGRVGIGAQRPHDIAVAAGLRAGSAALTTDPAHALAAVEAEITCRDLPRGTDTDDLRARACQLLDPANRANVLGAVVEAETALGRTCFDLEAISDEVLEVVSSRRATWNENHVRAATEDRVAVCRFDSDDDHRAAVEAVVGQILHVHSILLTVDPDPVPAALQRRNGESVFTGPAPTMLRYTSNAMLDREAELLAAAHTAAEHYLMRGNVTAAIASAEADDGRRLSLGQVRLVEHLCVAGTRLAVAVGAAGAGKTTAMRAAVQAWRASGRSVIALSPQKSAAKVLAEEIGIHADTIASLLWAHAHGEADPIPAGAMLLIDEAAMASTRDLVAVQRLADAAGAVVRWVGDPLQLSAVESGGALRLIAAETKAPELDTVVRFRDPEEAAATLHVRNGDPHQAWEFYAGNDRIRSGLAVELREQMLTAHLAELEQGLTSLMMAATLTDVHRLNGAAQTELARRGAVDLGSPSATLADKHRAHVGDIIVTRRNARRLRVAGGGRHNGSPVTNGDRWKVRTIHTDGSLTVSGIDHHGKVWLPPEYVVDNVELGYAVTVHRAQGSTVDRAHVLMNTSLGRGLAYVGLSRGRSGNTMYLATDTLPDPDHEPDEPLTASQVFARVLARTDDNLSATEVLRSELARVDDPARLREIYDYARQLLSRDRAVHLFERALPVVLFRQVHQGAGFDDLAATLDIADHLGLDIGLLVNDIVTAGGADERGASLLNARDGAAVLRARADRIIAAHISGDAATRSDEHPSQIVREFDESRAGELAVLPPRHPGADIELAEYAAQIRRRLLGGAAEKSTAPAEVSDIDAAADAHDEHPPIDRTASVRADYDHYTEQLAGDHARFLLDRALPVAVLRHVSDGRGWPRLCQTIATAAWHDLDPSRLVADITSGDLATVLSTRDAADMLAARADTWIGQHTGLIPAEGRAMPAYNAADGFTALRDLPHPMRLRPIPPPHPGMDTLVADHADSLRRELLGQSADSPGWRELAATAAILLDIDDLDDSLDTTATAATTARPTPQAGAESLLDDSGAEWITPPPPMPQRYPDLDPLVRVVRIHAEVAATHAHTRQLRQAHLDGSHPHQIAAAARAATMREIIDAQRPLRLAALHAQMQAQRAEQAAVDAEDTYQLMLTQQPEPVDEQLLELLHDRAMADTDDPRARAAVQEQLDRYRTAIQDRAQAQLSQAIENARRIADDHRQVADAKAADAAAADEALQAFAGGHGVLDETALNLVRLAGNEMAHQQEIAANEELHRLRARLRQARETATTTLQTEFGLDSGQASALLQQLLPLHETDDTPAPASNEHEHPTTGVEPPTLTADVTELDDAALAQHVADLSDLLHSLIPAPITHRDESVEDPADHLDARLSAQVEAIRFAQQAMALADANPDDTHLRDVAAAAVAAAAMRGAPRYRWNVLLKRVADTEARLRERAAATAAARHRLERFAHEQRRIDEVSAALSAALLERRRRFAAAHHDNPGTHHQPPSGPVERITDPTPGHDHNPRGRSPVTEL